MAKGLRERRGKMSEATREYVIEKSRQVIHAYINRINESEQYFDCISIEGQTLINNYSNNIEKQKDLFEDFLINDDFFENITDEQLLLLMNKCRELNKLYELNVRDIYKINEITQESGKKSDFIDTDYKVSLEEITYFINNYKSSANWDYNGHGSFIAKKNATLWELGGIYWNKLFKLPPDPNLIHIGDEIHLKQEVIDKIYEVSTSDVTGEYTFDPKEPEAIDLIYGIISYCAGCSDKVPKIIKYGLLDKDIKDTLDVLEETEETASKLSFFIQQYSTEGQEEDAWKKIISVASFLGPVFGFLGLLSNASVEENRYQIVQYNQRKAFLNSAQEEIERIQKIKSQVNEEQLQTEINYLRFLEKQIKILSNEIKLNDIRDKQQQAEILYNFSKYNTHGAVYKDDRSEKSPSYFHNIDYHKLFEEEK